MSHLLAGLVLAVCCGATTVYAAAVFDPAAIADPATPDPIKHFECLRDKRANGGSYSLGWCADFETEYAARIAAARAAAAARVQNRP